MYFNKIFLPPWKTESPPFFPSFGMNQYFQNGLELLEIHSLWVSACTETFMKGVKEELLYSSVFIYLYIFAAHQLLMFLRTVLTIVSVKVLHWLVVAEFVGIWLTGPFIHAQNETCHHKFLGRTLISIYCCILCIYCVKKMRFFGIKFSAIILVPMFL